ncbi:MAG TPA: cytochrome c oxidase assembly protein [Mucilaginibacter sp.]|jgi:cytochrome c oxidase assembly factor CtaG
MENIIYQWDFDLLIILFISSIIVVYYLMPGDRSKGKIVCFWTAVLLFVTATCSPLHFLGMHYYFSAHMIAHVIVLLICGPLLVISIPQNRSLLFAKRLTALSVFLHRQAWLCWAAGIGIMWFWHIPAIFNSSQVQMQGVFHFIPLLHAGSMLLAGMLFSWPLFGPVPEYRIHPLSGVIYLFTACISCSLLGLLITFAPVNAYHHYMATTPSMNMTSGNPWGISPVADRQAAGLVMWVPCCFVYLAGCIFLLHRWFSGSNNPDSTNNGYIKLSN